MQGNQCALFYRELYGDSSDSRTDAQDLLRLAPLLILLANKLIRENWETVGCATVLTTTFA